MGRAKEKWIESQEYADRYGIFSMDKGKKFVCADHFSDCYARQYAHDSGKNGTCSYCGKQAMPFDRDFAHWHYFIPMPQDKKQRRSEELR